MAPRLNPPRIDNRTRRPSPTGRSGGAFTAFGMAAEAEPLSPGLHIVATPIGNLRDVSFRALATLAAADAILAEDTRVTKILLAHYGITTPLVTYAEHNAAAIRPRLIERLRAGEALALVSDAGTPLVSDPGFKLVEGAIAAGIPVTGVPGPSAVMAALVVAGLPTDRFFFEGFLPQIGGAACAPGRAGRDSRHARSVRITAPATRDAGGRRRDPWPAAGGCRARTDQAVRDGAARHARYAFRRVCRGRPPKG